MSRGWRIFLGIVGGLVIIAVLVGAWFGLVPWLSKYLGPKPKDLGVKLTVEAAYEGATEMDMPTESKDLKKVLKDPKAYRRYDAKLSSEKASSLLLTGQNGIPHFPLYVVQIKFGSGGSAQASGWVRVANVKPFLSWLGVSDSDAATAVDKVRLFTDMPFYVSGTCAVNNNVTDLSLSEISFGRVTVPGAWYQGKESYGTKYIDSALSNNGFMVEKLAIENGEVQLKGTRPLTALQPWLHLVKRGGELP